MASLNSSTSTYSIKNLDHLGLVAGMCSELKIAQYVDAVLPEKTQPHHITNGQLLVAMILNGLGFTSRTLHMFPDYFADRPVERLIGPGILPEHINDDALGRCLDALFDVGVSEIYQVLAEQVIKQLNLKSTAVHLDITSFHVDGTYDSGGDDDETKRIKLVKGYSRDHRPELNQVILEMMTENQAGIPVYMQALSGNTNDQSAFKKVVQSHLHCLKAAQDSRYFVGDAALYVADTIESLHEQGQLFVSRVPMKLREAKALAKKYQAAQLTPMNKGYSGMWVDENYAGVPQKWLLVSSEQATKRERHTLDKNILKSRQDSVKQFNKLAKKRFACEKDALDALAAFAKQQTYLEILTPDTIAIPIFSASGRPKKGQAPDGYEFQVTGSLVTSLEKVELAQQQAGLFIIATNDCSGELSMDELLDTYKSQQSVERGFRFLKSHEFLTSSLFLKKPERIEALLMVMTCSLMIYAALEYRIRTGLTEKGLYFPDMKKKPTQKPTARWVFLCFNGIHELKVDETPPMIVNLQDRQQTILSCLGHRYQKIYS